MTIRYEITKSLSKILRNEMKPNKVVFCIGEHCNNVRFNENWYNYRNLCDYERKSCSSGLCPDCYTDAVKLNSEKRLKKLNKLPPKEFPNGAIRK